MMSVTTHRLNAHPVEGESTAGGVVLIHSVRNGTHLTLRLGMAQYSFSPGVESPMALLVLLTVCVNRIPSHLVEPLAVPDTSLR